MHQTATITPTSRRRFLGQLGLGALALGTGAARAADIRLPLPSAPRDRAMTTAFPQKGAMILQRTRPPLLETPFEVFDQGVFTPNDRFFVRWHWAVIPEAVDVDRRSASTVRGARRHAEQSLTGSSRPAGDAARRARRGEPVLGQFGRGLFEPRVAGGQWRQRRHGQCPVGRRAAASDVLDRAGVKPGCGVRCASTAWTSQ